jgi:DNA processing protein
MNDPRLYWVGFNYVKGIGAARFRALLDFFGEAEAAWRASPAELRATGLSEKLVGGIVKARTSLDLERIWDRIQEQKITVLTWADEDYPRRLKEIDAPPPVLYLRGGLLPQDEWAVAIVGTRRITAYGRQVAEEVAGLLAAKGVTVVSGLARGVDGVAHTSALRGGGRTLAVLGCGVDQIYPPEHRTLSERVVASGALISDYAPGTPPDGVNFPPRNRIISGLSLAVVVIEAGETSGALITAKFAAEQGREVFAVPGYITAPSSVGANRLIQQGARPLLDCQELLEVLNLSLLNEQVEARTVLPADPVEAQLLSVLSAQPLHVDELRGQTDLPIETVSAALALMELKGMVRQVGGMQYVAMREARGDYEI